MKRLITLVCLIYSITNLSAQTINYTYDNLGRVTKVAYPDSCTITYTYDASGNRVSSITNNICFTTPQPTIAVTGNVVFCAGDSVILTSSNSANYLWSTGGRTQKIVVKQSGKYAVNALYSSSCTKTSDSVTITVNPRPKAIITAIGNTVFCNGDSVILKAETSNAYSYRWSTGATSSSIIVKNADVYKLYITNSNGCIDSTSTSVTVNPLPIVIAGMNKVICEGPKSQIQIGSPSVAGNTYSWSPTTGLIDATLANPFANPSLTTTYTLKVTNTFSCSKISDPVTITVNPRPKAMITAIGKTVFCTGDSVILKAETSNTYSYRWSTGATSSSIIIKNTGVYKLYITNSNGCVDSTSNSVTVNPLPIAFAGSDNTICDSPNAQIQIGSPPVAGNTYSWSPINGLSNATISNPIVKPTSTLVYTLLVTNTFGCSASSKVTITKVPFPFVDAGEKIAINVGSSTIIGASPTARGNNPFYYQWTPSLGLNNNTFSNPFASPNTTTTYTVHVTDKYGCIDSSSIYIAVIQTDKKFIVYPNPTNDKISIIGADIQDGTWKLSIITMSGLTILNNIQIQATNKSLFYEFSIKNLVSAIYILRIENDSYRESTQIIKLNRN